MAGNRSLMVQSGEKYEVDPIELFFDLFYAFAISQLTVHLLHNLSWSGVLETLVLLVPIYIVWAYTSWAATMVRADRAVTRLMILLVMAAGFLMSIYVPEAFSSSGWVFVGTYLLIQFGRTFWTIAQISDAFSRGHSIRVLIWQIVSAMFWIIGACVSTNSRLLFWLIAAGIDLIGTWLAHPVFGRKLVSESIDFNVPHLLERCRLFRLIAIGEMVFTLGEAVSSVALTPITIILGIVSLIEIIALWALTYGRFVNVVATHITTTTNPMRAGHYAISALSVILFGLVCISAANEQIILHPLERPSFELSFLLGAGPILFLAAQGWYLKMIPNVSPRNYITISTLLLLVGVGSHFFAAWIGLVIVVILIVILAVHDNLLYRLSFQQGPR